MRLALLALLLLFTAGSAYAAPSSTGLSGTDTLVISGAWFGTKTTAAPVIWDNFDSGTTGADIGSEGTWTKEEALVATYTESDNRTGTGKNIRMEAKSAEYNDGTSTSGVAYYHLGTSKKKLVSFWVRSTFENVSDTDTWQIKLASIERSTSHASAPGIAEHIYRCADGAGDCKGAAGTDANTAYWYTGPTLSLLSNLEFDPYYEGEWEHVTILYEESDYGVADGNVIIYKSSTASTPSAIEKETSLNKISQTVEGSVAEYVKLRAIRANYSGWIGVNYDDVYVDTTWARVEIGDNADYDLCTHREIQIPSAWDDTEITVSLNQGTFANDETAYLFVIDEDGNASTGYAFTVSGTATTEPSTNTYASSISSGLTSIDTNGTTSIEVQ